MAHELTVVDGSTARSIYARVRRPSDVPWHKCGIQGEKDESILDVASRLILPHVTLLPAYYQLPSGVYVPADDYRCIVGALPDSDGPYTSPAGTKYRREVYGTVAGRYHLYTPGVFVEDFSQAIPAPCETMGTLKKGATTFISVILPTFAIAGDEHRPYLLATSTTDGISAIQCKITSVRVVCQNTLSMALGKTTEQSTAINHLSDPSPRVRAFLAECWEASSSRVAAMTEACELLAAHPLVSSSLDSLLASFYPTSPRPDVAVSHDLSDDALTLLAEWEAANKHQLSHRSAVAELFESSPTITTATAGNVWGAYQALCEYEDYYKPRATALSRFVGEASKRKARAFDLCLALVNS